MTRTPPLRPHLRRVVAFCVCRCWVVTRLVTGRVRAHSCVREMCEMCARRLHAAWGVTVHRIILPFARGCRVGVWFGFVRATLLPAVGTCVVLSFGVMPGWCCFLRVTLTAQLVSPCILLAMAIVVAGVGIGQLYYGVYVLCRLGMRLRMQLERSRGPAAIVGAFPE